MTTGDSNLASLANLAANEMVAANPSLRGAPAFSRSVAISEYLGSGKDATDKLKNAISADESLGHLRVGWIQQKLGGQVIQDHNLPFMLVSKAIDGNCIEAFLKDARAFAASVTSGIETFTAVVGVSLAQAVSLGHGIDIIPWSDVPDCRQKDTFGDVLSAQEIMAGPRLPFRNKATAAIRVCSQNRQVLFSSHGESQSAIDAPQEEQEAATTLQVIADVVRCVTALKSCPVAVVGSWSMFDQKIANEFMGTGYMWTGAFWDFGLVHASCNPISLDGKNLSELFYQFEKFKSSEKDVLRTGLDRLNQAIRERQVVDKAIDLGIALEVVLLHGINTGDRGEMRYRSSIRGATFLGGEKEQRLKTYQLLREAYDLRSKAVHAGAIDIQNDHPDAKQVLEEGTKTCAEIVRKLVEVGHFPKWEDEYVLGN